MKLLFAVFALAICFSVNAQIPEAPTQGTGTPSDPFHIASFGNLYWIAITPGIWSMHFIQTADIDASESEDITDSDPNTAGWIPIGHVSPFFTGSYDGQGYMVQNLVQYRQNLNYSGFFGYMAGAKLSRVHLRDVSISGTDYTGGLAGVANAGSVVNHCSVTGSVTGRINVGGLLGYCDGSVTANCYSHASVTATSDQAGGFVGLSGWNNPSYHNFCYSTGSVNALNALYKGGFMGRSGSVTLKDCYWDTQTSGILTDPLAAGKSTAQMKQQSTYVWWNFRNLWSITEGISYPDLDRLSLYDTPPALTLNDLMGSGIGSDPYILMNTAQLNVIRLDPTACYQLGADIDLDASVVWNHGRGWEPVGSLSTPFTGILDGNGYSINGLSIFRPQTDYIGLFGYVNGGAVHDLQLPNAYVLGKAFCGGVAGYSKSGSLAALSLEGRIIAHRASGGLAGALENGSIQGSRADVEMKTTMEFTGGLAGYITSSGSISGLISGSSSQGSIQGQSNLGGITGLISWGTVQDCFSHVAVSGLNFIGGMVGSQGTYSNPGYISRCYSTGPVTLSPGGTNAGGLVAMLYNGSIQASYWDVNTSGMTTSSGLGSTGLSTAQMTYPGSLDYFGSWDFASIWRQDTTLQQNNGYPYLAWQEVPVPEAVQNLVISASEGQFLLEWQAVDGVSLYNIYASEDPDAPWSQWNYVGQSAGTSMVVSGGDRRFFIVRSVGMERR